MQTVLKRLISFFFSWRLLAIFMISLRELW